LCKFRGELERFRLEQNSAEGSKQAKLAREGHQVAWEFESPGRAYTGRVLIDGVVYTTAAEAAKKFFEANKKRRPGGILGARG
jgi:hypothetical protein